jgi:hypothetical protein
MGVKMRWDQEILGKFLIIITSIGSLVVIAEVRTNQLAFLFERTFTEILSFPGS